MSSSVEPQNLDAELELLGGLIADSSLFPKVVDAGLQPSHFFFESHGAIFYALSEMSVAGKAIDAVTLADELDKRGSLAKVGGRAKVHELACHTPARATVVQKARIVREMWEKREVLRALEPHMAALRNGKRADSVLSQAESTLVNLRGVLERGRASIVTSFAAAENLEARVKNPPKEEPGVPTPFSFLPSLKGGRLYLLGGYIADGKSAIAGQFVMSACDGGKRVGIISLEMPAADVYDRLVSCFGVPYRQVTTGHVLQAHLPAYNHAVSTIARWQLEVIDDEKADLGAMFRYQQLGHYDLLIIDHFHQMQFKDRFAIEAALRAFKRLARRFEIPILLLVQLSRSPAGHGHTRFPRPSLASIRETGMAEAVADAVYFVWRHRDENDLPGTNAELIVAKNRFGPVGTHPMFFRPTEVRFVEDDE